MDAQAAEIGAWVGGAIATALGAVLAVLRRRRRRGKGGSFRPRARFRGYFSVRTHDSAPPGASMEPPPFDDRDTGNHRKRHERGPDHD